MKMKIEKRKIKFEQRLFVNLAFLLLTLFLIFIKRIIIKMITMLYASRLITVAVYSWGKIFSWTINLIVMGILITISVELLIELKRRKWRVTFLWVSVISTFHMWHGMIRQSDSLGESQKKLVSYNRAVRRVAVYVDPLETLFAIPIPWDNQAHELLDGQKIIMREKLNLMLGDKYLFSDFLEKSGYLWMKGTHRQDLSRPRLRD